MHVHLKHENSVLVSYNILIEGLKTLLFNPLPRENVKDTIQIRCLIDEIPYRSSSAYISSYITEERFIKELSNTFVVNLTSNIDHIIQLQWKKIGNSMNKWIIVKSLDNSSTLTYSLNAIADHQKLLFSSETTNSIINTNGIWKHLSNDISFSIDKNNTNIIIGYSVIVQQQIKNFIKGDKRLEYISSRIVIDNIPYNEGSMTYSTVSWNPSGGILQGVIPITLPHGTYSLQLQWRKLGTSFDNWISNPATLDGFASSRNIYILYPKNNIQSISLPEHTHTQALIGYNSNSNSNDNSNSISKLYERNILHGKGIWSTVANHIISFKLYKESAIYVKFLLPMSQYSNGYFTSGHWETLTTVRTRLLIDNIPYIFPINQLSSMSRIIDSISGEIGLTLPIGSHTIALQWENNGICNWTILNNIDKGYTNSDQMLVLISSENSIPIITAPNSIYGYENVHTVFTGISIEDVDDLIRHGE